MLSLIFKIKPDTQIKTRIRYYFTTCFVQMDVKLDINLKSCLFLYHIYGNTVYFNIFDKQLYLQNHNCNLCHKKSIEIKFGSISSLKCVTFSIKLHS